ncbi:hypothetical protein CEK26_005018 [Fusarium fujikuroi]|nr:hypothetical protein CEK26_005018 [Fusarium fujikuroi]
MANRWLLRPSLAFIALITQSNSAILNPDKNPVLSRVLQWTIYDHFCAGNSIPEVSNTVKYIKNLGFHVIILGYSKDVVLDPNVKLPKIGIEDYPKECYDMIDEWKKGNIDTLNMIEAGDLLAVKVTGAGPIAVDALQAGKPMNSYLHKALNDICSETQRRGCQLWIDAEQQAMQPTLDEWTITLMREHNRDGNALVYNTIQAYLKGARQNAKRHIQLAAQEGWTVGIKLVRGAYIENEIRSLIHDTKDDTDSSYNDIADMLISRRVPDGPSNLKFPDAALVLATHNAESAQKALSTHRKRLEAGLPTVPMKCAQIMGMADELSCKLLQDYEQAVKKNRVTAETPKIYNYLRALERRQDGLPSPGSLGNGSRPRPRHSSVSDYGISGVVTRDASMTADGDLTLGTPQDHDENDETNEAASLSTNDVLEPAFRQNPLVDNDYVFGQAMGRYWYMGPASSWAFCRRVLALVGKHLPEANNEPLPWHLDGVAFRLQWRPLMPDEPPDISNLPPSDYAYFLIQTARFYLGPLASLIDEAEFLQHFKELYQDASAKAVSCKLWYAQYLLMIAFGKAFLGGKSADGSPPGYQYAARAMPLMPELAGIALDPVLSAQALTLAAIYFQSIDMRVAAYQHIGQALRICVLSGFHRHMPEEAVGAQHSKRCHIVFWVVYMLDQEFAALIGATSAIRDEDITNKLPSQADSSLSSLSLTLHVQLARLIARLLGTVYGVGKDYDGTLFSNTQSILRNLAELNRDLNNIINNHFRDSISKASRIATRLLLQYHHCVVLTTRPQIMCALHMHIEQSKTQLLTHGLSLSPPVASLIQSCVSSAQAILKTLRALADEDLIEAFLPFQIEYASSSAFLLHLIPIICPPLLSDDSWRDDARYVFDTLIAKGSLIAPLRKVELEQLEQKLSALTPASNIATPEVPNQVEEHVSVQEEENGEPELDEHVSDETGWDLFAANAMAGLTPGELLDLAEQLDVDSFLYQPEIELSYQYRPIEDASIRLVRILPERKTMIKCEIIHVSLEQPPPYKAISYTWGDTGDTRKIEIEGCLIPIAVSLHGALQALRKKQSSVLVWADALCINQKDRDERSQQVQLMPFIYSNADSVAIWLGPEENDSTRAVSFLDAIATTGEPFGSSNISKLLAAGAENGDLLAVVSLFGREYWRRLWVVQEVFNAKRIMVHSGSTRLEWKKYQSASVLFSQRRGELIFNNKDQLKRRLAASPDQFSYVQTLIYQGPASLPDLKFHMSDGEEALLQVLRTCRRKLASDPRDKLYGILGVLPASIRDEFRADYNLSVKDVYTEIVDFLLKTTEKLDIICEAIHFPVHTSTANLPTFVPDWSHIPQTSAMGFKYNFSASGSSKAICRFRDERLNKLEISGLEIDVVQSKGVVVGTLCNLGDYLVAFLHWRALLLQAVEGRNEQELQMAEECFAATICLGQIPSDLLLGNSIRG